MNECASPYLYVCMCYVCEKVCDVFPLFPNTCGNYTLFITVYAYPYVCVMCVREHVCVCEWVCDIYSFFQNTGSRTTSISIYAFFYMCECVSYYFQLPANINTCMCQCVYVFGREDFTVQSSSSIYRDREISPFYYIRPFVWVQATITSSFTPPLTPPTSCIP